MTRHTLVFITIWNFSSSITTDVVLVLFRLVYIFVLFSTYINVYIYIYTFRILSHRIQLISCVAKTIFLSFRFNYYFHQCRTLGFGPLLFLRTDGNDDIFTTKSPKAHRCIIFAVARLRRLTSHNGRPATPRALDLEKQRNDDTISNNTYWRLRRDGPTTVRGYTRLMARVRRTEIDFA